MVLFVLFFLLDRHIFNSDVDAGGKYPIPMLAANSWLPAYYMYEGRCTESGNEMVHHKGNVINF